MYGTTRPSLSLFFAHVTCYASLCHLILLFVISSLPSILTFSGHFTGKAKDRKLPFHDNQAKLGNLSNGGFAPDKFRRFAWSYRGRSWGWCVCVCVCVNVCLLTTYFKSQEPTYQLWPMIIETDVVWQRFLIFILFDLLLEYRYGSLVSQTRRTNASPHVRRWH